MTGKRSPKGGAISPGSVGRSDLSRSLNGCYVEVHDIILSRDSNLLSFQLENGRGSAQLAVVFHYTGTFVVRISYTTVLAK